jgi:Inorganic pyrophosphatase
MLLRTVEQVRRIFRIVAGFTLLLAGVVMLVTPGPGWVVILLGLGLLAAEFVWARRLMDRIKREGTRIKDTVLGKPEPPEPEDPPRPPTESPASGDQIPS